MSDVACACGCGAETLFGRIEALAAEGNTRAQIASALGMTREHLKSVLRKPPRYIKGHWRADTASKLRAARTFASQRAFDERGMARRYAATESKRSHGRFRDADRRRGREFRQKAWTSDLRAFDLGMMAAASERLNPRPTVGLALVRVRLTLEGTRRQLVERDQEEIDALRNLVGLGWNQDREPQDRRLTYMDSFDTKEERYRVEAFLWEEEQRRADDREREREHEAAAAVLDSAPLFSLVRLALSNPDALRANERETLRLHYERALGGQRLPLAHRTQLPGIPEGLEKIPKAPIAVEVGYGNQRGGSVSRGRGGGHHTGAYTVGTKRFEGKREIALERAIREARRVPA